MTTQTVGRPHHLRGNRNFRTFMIGETVSELGGAIGSSAQPLEYLAITTPAHLQGRVASFEQFVGALLMPAAPMLAAGAVTAWSPGVALGVFATLAGLELLILVTSRSVGELPRIAELAPAP